MFHTSFDPVDFVNQQIRKSVPSLQNPKDANQVEKLAKMDEGVWVRAEWRPRYAPKAFWLETAFITPPVSETSSTAEIQETSRYSSAVAVARRLKQLGPLLMDFFQCVQFVHANPSLIHGVAGFGLGRIRLYFSSAQNKLCLCVKVLP
jgi:hypothetical protein